MTAPPGAPAQPGPVAGRPYAPVFIERVLDDPGLVRHLVEANAPYYPVQRYVANAAEYRAISGDGAQTFIAPNFRGDWAYDEPRIDGVEPILHHEGFAAAAREVLRGEVVRPQQVYSNLTWQLPFPQGRGHTDVPAFRGVDRTRVPIWLLLLMGHSGLFERWRVDIATAVAWFYEGRDGGFTWWPDGPDAPPRVHEGDIHNTAIVGDNDFMFHRVNPVGAQEDGILQGMTLETRLSHRDDGGWYIEQDGAVRARLPFEALRISISWKAMVFRDAEEARCFDEHRDDLALDDVFAHFRRDLAARGVACDWPVDPLRSPALVGVLDAAYGRAPRAG